MSDDSVLDLSHRADDSKRETLLKDAIADVLSALSQERRRLAAIREWAERAAAGYDAGNYNITATPQQACGEAILAILNRSDTDE